MNTAAPLPEITVKSVVLGVLLSVILAGANAYLGLFAGMTVSASIPAAVVSMGVLRLFRRASILENNLVQTAASAGESLAAGVIFTVPALVLMGYWQRFDYLEIARISALGGVIGVLFTVPLRRALVVEAGLRYPEGVATAAVLKTGEQAREGEGRNGVGLLLSASLVGGLMKLAQQAFGLWPAVLEGAVSVRGALFGLGGALSPTLVAVGFIVGRNIAILVFAGGLISWMIAIPLYTGLQGGFAGADLDVAYAIWNEKIRYLGVGAMVVGGIWSIVHLFRPLIQGIRSSLQAYRRLDLDQEVARQELDIPIHWVGIGLLLAAIPLLLLYLSVIPELKIAILLSLVMLVFGFLFSAVAGYMAGVVGSSNNPVSGVTIATILFTSLLLLAIQGAGSLEGAASAIIIGAVVCCAAAIAGDTLQDLKAGQLVGATPWKQQLMQIIGVMAAAVVLGFTLEVLHSAYEIGSRALPAPQATLMRSVADGVFRGDLPWNFVLLGAVLGALIIAVDQVQQWRGAAFRLPVLAVAVGIYLPVSLSLPIFVGGLLAHFAVHRDPEAHRGILCASGLITGEALMGILVAVPIFVTANKDWWPALGSFPWLGAILFAGVAAWLYRTAARD